MSCSPEANWPPGQSQTSSGPSSGSRSRPCRSAQGPRESALATVRPEGARRLYAVEAARLNEVDAWLHPFRHFWERAARLAHGQARTEEHERRLADNAWKTHAEGGDRPMIDVVS